MKEKISIAVMVGAVALGIGLTVAATYSAFSIGKTQEQANIFESECLSIKLENESSAITINKTSPITDLEGLDQNGYTFTVKNTCKTPINYLVNLESLNETSNTLNGDYIKVSLSSSTMDNYISTLSNNPESTPIIESAYKSNNLYTGTLLGESSKEFNLKLWLDYDTTVAQGANKTYSSKISVLAKSNNELTVTETPEYKTTIDNFNLTGTITGNASTLQYCESTNNVCAPNTSLTFTNNRITEIINRDNTKMICTKLDNNKTTCTRVAELRGQTSSTILADIKKRTDGSYKGTASLTYGIIATGAETEENNGIYETTDPMYGNRKTYYWRGAATTNHVIFANKCWRIVRINGDGSMRLIYNGSVQSGNQCKGNGANADSVVKTSVQYNKYSGLSPYVGWTYTEGQQRPSGSGTPSDAKTQLELWYNSNITGANSDKVSEGNFCNDRTVGRGGDSTTWSASGTGFYYAPLSRMNANSPSLDCSYQDKYYLKVGLITSDEVILAGASYRNSNRSYYLYNGQKYWTMSPASYGNGSGSVVIFVDTDGDLPIQNNVGYYYYLRPVLNLKSNTLFNVGSDGTQYNPYVVQ